jgi:hypothetical protein
MNAKLAFLSTAAVVVAAAIIGSAVFLLPRGYSVERFEKLAQAELGTPRTEQDVLRIFGVPSSIRRGDGYRVLAYQCPKGVFWVTECLVRIEEATGRSSAWQLDSD